MNADLEIARNLVNAGVKALTTWGNGNAQIWGNIAAGVAYAIIGMAQKGFR